MAGSRVKSKTGNTPARKSKTQSGKLYFIEAVKGISIIFIALFHYVHDLARAHQRAIIGTTQTNFSRLLIFPFIAKSSWLANAIAVISSFGWHYVGVFLALSGFTLTYSRVINGDKGNFLKRRFMTFIPYFHLAVIFAFIVNFISRRGFHLEPFIYQIQSLDISHYLYMLLFPGVIDFTFQHLTVVNSTLWYVILIFQFYFMYDIFYAVLQKMGWKKFLFWSVLLTLTLRAMFVYYFNEQPVALWADGTRSMTFFTLFPARLSEFSAGMVLGYLFGNKKISEDFFKSTYSFILATATWLLGIYATYSIFGWIFSDTLLTFGLFYMTAYVVMKIMDFSRIYKGLILMGTYSFVIYLFHAPLITQVFMPMTAIMNNRFGHMNIVFLFFIALTLIWVYVLALFGKFLKPKISAIFAKANI